MERKIFVLDTSAIIALVQDLTTFRDPNAPLFAGVLGDNEIVIPRVVLDELERLRRKTGDERVKIATQAARQIEKYSTLGLLLEGVETEKGGVLRLAPRPAHEKMIAWGLDPSVPDQEILGTAITIEDSLRTAAFEEGDYDHTSELLSKTVLADEGVEAAGEMDDEAMAADFREPSSELSSPVILITQDRLLRVLARSMYGVCAQELESVCAPTSLGGKVFRREELDSSQIDQIIETGSYQATEPMFVNSFVHLVDREDPENRYCYGICRQHHSTEVGLIDRNKVDYLRVAGEVMGKNVRQKLFLWALMGCGEPDPMAEDGIRLITASGPAGSGKSFLTLAAAWERLERGHFDRIIITRPMVDVGTSMGFLPGTLEEKLKPWGGPVEDNLRAIVQVPNPAEGRGGSVTGGSQKRGLQRSVQPFDAKTWLEMEGRLELVPLTYIRGRTFRRCFVILEEAQNLERGPLKVLLTRLGEGSVVVVLGDSSQIDNQFLSSRNNGLVHAINAFRSWPQSIHLELNQIVRSDLAEAATTRL